MKPFELDLVKIRNEVKRNIEEGAVTPEYKANRREVLSMLDKALATEWVCVLRYRQNAQVAQGIYSDAVIEEFLEHANDEQNHAERLADRIQQLGGQPDLNPATLLQRSSSQYVEGQSVAEMIQENLIAERTVIEIYGEMIRCIGDADPTTRRLLEDILKDEEDHADDLATLLISFNPRDKIA